MFPQDLRNIMIYEEVETRCSPATIQQDIPDDMSTIRQKQTPTRY